MSTIDVQKADTVDYDRRAEFYDLEFSTQSDRSTIQQFITPRVRRILEVPCGSGRNVAWLSAPEHRTTYADLSAPMIRQVKLKIAQLSPEARSQSEGIVADITTFKSEEPFDLIIVPREGLQVLPKSAVSAALCNLSLNLAPNGRIYLDIARCTPARGEPHPDQPTYIQEQSDKFSLDMSYQTRGQTFKRWHRTTRQPHGLMVEFRYQIMRDGTQEKYSTSFDLVEITESELEGFMAFAGLEVVARYGDYDGGQLTSNSPRIIYVARKPE